MKQNIQGHPAFLQVFQDVIHYSISLGLKLAPFDPTNERFVRSQHFLHYHEDEEGDSSLPEAAERAAC